MFIELHIETKHNLPKELEIVSIIRDLQLKYQTLPVFTQKVMIESGSTPHSHPALTLNTRETDPLHILRIFLHEQFHWHASGHQLYQPALSHLKTVYKDLGDCNLDGKHPDSFWIHLIVCWNTRNSLTKLIGEDELGKAYKDDHSYPLTEKFVVDNFEKLKLDLAKFDLVYEQ